MAKIELPEYGKHIVFLGATGSGKTFFAERMLSNYDKTFVIDTQDGLNVEGKRITKPDPNFLGLKFALEHTDKLHYIPKPEFLDREAWDYIFRNILLSSSKRKPNRRIIYIDEIFDLGYGFMNFPRWLVKSIPTARQKQLSYWISTQEPKNIPGNVLSQASKIYVFSLAKAEHIKYVSSFVGEGVKEFEAILQALRKRNNYSFIEIDNRKGTWREMPPIKK